MFKRLIIKLWEKDDHEYIHLTHPAVKNFLLTNINKNFLGLNSFNIESRLKCI